MPNPSKNLHQNVQTLEAILDTNEQFQDHEVLDDDKKKLN